MAVRQHPICPFLRPLMRDLLQRRGESVRWLSKISRVEYQKVYRLECGELASLTFFDARKLLKVLDPDNYINHLKEFYPVECQDLADWELSDDELERQLESISLIFESEQRAKVYFFATETPRADHALIIKRYGEEGVDLLEEFLSKGTISIGPDGEFVGVLKSSRSASTEQLEALILTTVGLVDFGEAGSLGSAHGGGLNSEGRKKGYWIVSKAKEDLQKLYQDPKYRGAFITLYSLVFGSMGKEQKN